LGNGWLAEIGLGHHEGVFASNNIAFDVIHLVTDAPAKYLMSDRK
jgi:hypothetical protein